LTGRFAAPPPGPAGSQQATTARQSCPIFDHWIVSRQEQDSGLTQNRAGVILDGRQYCYATKTRFSTLICTLLLPKSQKLAEPMTKVAILSAAFQQDCASIYKKYGIYPK
jgi:hypothetical protein